MGRSPLPWFSGTASTTDDPAVTPHAQRPGLSKVTGCQSQDVPKPRQAELTHLPQVHKVRNVIFVQIAVFAVMLQDKVLQEKKSRSESAADLGGRGTLHIQDQEGGGVGVFCP